MAFASINALPASPSDSDIAVAILEILAFSVISAILSYRVFAHAKVIATADGLIISNPFRGDQRIKWSEIVDIKPDRLLIITTTDDRKLIAWAIQKNGWNRWRHERTQADEAIDQMSRLATEQTGEPREFVRA